MRGQAGDEHGGPPWFKEESSPAGWRELLTPWGDERVRSLSHRGAVSFKGAAPHSALSDPVDAGPLHRAIGAIRYCIDSLWPPACRILEAPIPPEAPQAPISCSSHLLFSQNP